MLNYTDNQILLKSIFQPDLEVIPIEGSQVVIRRMDFESQVAEPYLPSLSLPVNSLLVTMHETNNRFQYPVFMPSGDEKVSGAIVMLHGLNERNWSKYLSWAQRLAEKTGKGVILFPLAFHINRSPGDWSDPRRMKSIAEARSHDGLARETATVFNAALSSRLDHHPEWFCTSGLQSSYDILSLVQSIQQGRHPLFSPGASVDFFAYSVGAFLLEVLLLADPDNILSESKSFLFLGGSSFEQMQGISKYILDGRAFDKLEEAFIRQNPEAVKGKIHLPRLDSFNPLWNGFMAMLRLDRHAQRRQRALRRIGQRMSVVAMENDRVIPAGAI